VTALARSSILVTGGTGSFGRQFIRYALDKLDPARVIVFSRDELTNGSIPHADPVLWPLPPWWAVDIDTEEDLEFVERLLARRQL
jgi:dTDP-D-glucose 4,6-dehydratase